MSPWSIPIYRAVLPISVTDSLFTEPFIPSEPLPPPLRCDHVPEIIQFYMYNLPNTIPPNQTSPPTGIEAGPGRACGGRRALGSQSVELWGADLWRDGGCIHAGRTPLVETHRSAANGVIHGSPT